MGNKDTFLFAKWTVEVYRRPFRRSVSIYLYPKKPIKVIVAKNTPQKAIVDFLMKKQEWIEKSFEKFAEISEKFPERKIKSQEAFPFLGKELQLQVVITLHRKSFVSVTDKNLLLHIPRNNWSADSLHVEHPAALNEIRQFYKREAVVFLSKQVKFWSERMNLYPSQIKFREQRTRWGSCSTRKIINLNWRLIVFAQEIIDYVIVHELAHLQHMNHSQKFWSLVEQHIENYKDVVKSLKESQHLVEFLTEKK
ncbi:MAG: M48 family metallopeptidase [Bdellovibrio sp.]